MINDYMHLRTERGWGGFRSNHFTGLILFTVLHDNNLHKNTQFHTSYGPKESMSVYLSIETVRVLIAKH